MTSWLDAPPCSTHSWRWVPTWTNIGFDECWRCGVTGPVREGSPLPVAGVVSESRVAVSAEDAPIDAFVAVKWAKNGDSAERNAAVLAALAAGDRAVVIAKRFGITAARVYQIKGAAKPLVATEGACS